MHIHEHMLTVDMVGALEESPLDGFLSPPGDTGKRAWGGCRGKSTNLSPHHFNLPLSDLTVVLGPGLLLPI